MFVDRHHRHITDLFYKIYRAKAEELLNYQLNCKKKKREEQTFIFCKNNDPISEFMIDNIKD